jgi:hypothetical protein
MSSPQHQPRCVRPPPVVLDDDADAPAWEEVVVGRAIDDGQGEEDVVTGSATVEPDEPVSSVRVKLPDGPRDEGVLYLQLPARRRSSQADERRKRGSPPPSSL